ncbi:hypothetical protein P7K49_036514 [Saguinus oedipus]|uniref:CKLF like MARVEL transmembrane domain containing 3 n=1 Tax=Saguinus oedipus TaxID=9490 RepID=A0ABQ9TKD3_SAGOE|nr:hypothetical protein P7K49_036514 [Saguinus oedipus]
MSPGRLQPDPQFFAQSLGQQPRWTLDTAVSAAGRATEAPRGHDKGPGMWDFLRCVTAALIYFAISITAVAKYSDGASKAAGVSRHPTLRKLQMPL